MPYLNIIIAKGRSEQTRRRLVAGLAQVALDVLDSVPEDVHVAVWELDPANLGEGTGSPEPVERTNSVSMLLARGRSPQVLRALLKALTDVVVTVLDVPAEWVHVVLNEQPYENIGEAGVPMAPPRDPAWLVHAARR